MFDEEDAHDDRSASHVRAVKGERANRRLRRVHRAGRGQAAVASVARNRRLRRARRAGRGQVAVAQTVLASPAAEGRLRSGVGRAAGTRAGHLPPPGRLDQFSRLLSH